MDSVIRIKNGRVVARGYPYDVELWLYRELMFSSGLAYDIFEVSAGHDSHIMSVRRYLIYSPLWMMWKKIKAPANA